MALVEKFLASKYTIWIILIIHFIIWFTVFLFLDIHPDMADHWIWSRSLTFGYYEHPPFVALTMRFVSLIFTDVVFGLKLGSVLFSAVILCLGYLAASEFFDRKTALVFVLILFSTPYFSTGSVFWHIDQPFMAFWLICLLIIGKYITTQNANWILLFGLAAGLGAMSKYTMILLPLSMIVWLIVNAHSRKLLSYWQAYVGALIALAVVFPNIYWNSQHEWVTFGFVLDKGLKEASFGVHFLQFLVSQFFLFSIVYTVFFWWQYGSKNLNASIISNNKVIADQKWTFLFYTGLVPFLFFTLTSFLGSQTDPYWVNVSYFSFFMLLARFIVVNVTLGQTSRQVTLFVSSTLITCFIFTIGIARNHSNYIPFNFPDVTSIKIITGWEKTAYQIKSLYEYNKIKIPDYVISRDYRLSSELGLYMANHPQPHTIEKKLRNMWSPVSKVKTKGALLVCPTDECLELLEKAGKRFHSKFRYLGEIRTVQSGKVLRKLKVFNMPPK